MFDPETLQHDILDEFRDAQYPMLERASIRRARKALLQRREVMVQRRIARSLEHLQHVSNRLRTPAIAPLPPRPLNAGARRMQEIWAERRRTAGVV